MKVATILLVGLIGSGCASEGKVRCDGRLVPINSPSPVAHGGSDQTQNESYSDQDDPR